MAEPGGPWPPVLSPLDHAVWKATLLAAVFSWPPPSLQLGSFVLQTNSSLEVIHQNKQKFEGSIFILK